MAVRRISDLPMLSAYYPAAQLSDCVMEVSYAKPNDAERRIYQSFQTNVQDAMLCAIQASTDSLPKASKNSYGVVKVGSSIDVSNGTISVPNATASIPGIITLPPNCSSNEVLSYDSNNGGWIPKPLGSGQSSMSIQYVKPLIGDVINMVYPVGSMFITYNKNGCPPGIPNLDNIDANNCVSANVECASTGTSTPDIITIQWKNLIDNNNKGASLWGVKAKNVATGNLQSGSLPSLDSAISFETTENGNHYHRMVKGTVAVDGSEHRHTSVIYSISAPGSTNTSAAQSMENDGSHSHTISRVIGPNNLYYRTDNYVCPTSWIVNFWVRTR